MSTRYLILQTAQPIHDMLESRSAQGFEANASQLSIAIEEGRERDAGALRADPRNAAVLDADAVFSLIKPLARSALATSDLDAALTTMGALKMAPGIIAVGAHSSNFTGQGVRVAVLDTGLDVTHPAFAGKEIVARDFTGEGTADSDVTDQNGHGTHCAGTVCGAPVAGVRVGVAPGVTKLVVGKVLGSKGGSLEMLLKGMLWAVLEQQADIVSMSLGYDLPGNIARLIEHGVDPQHAGQAAMQLQNDIIKGVGTLRAFLESQSKNVLFAAATGNESKRATGFVLGAGLPAAELLPVGAVGPLDVNPKQWQVAPFSNGRAAMVAPGVNVVSAASGGGWATMSGTSMATPHVAGVAALWVEKLRAAGSLSVPGAVRAALQAGTTRQPLVDSDIDAIGTGLVQSPTN